MFVLLVETIAGSAEVWFIFGACFPMECNIDGGKAGPAGYRRWTGR